MTFSTDLAAEGRGCGWFGDSEGHARAARSRRDDDDDDDRRGRSRSSSRSRSRDDDKTVAAGTAIRAAMPRRPAAAGKIVVGCGFRGPLRD
ncbi:MAG: hypothetical protein GEV13_19980 [Rhodospirillales bacterium]|nr:hypothetical protein [Rhodospirillales bacterium]